MTNTDLEIFMEKLKMLVYENYCTTFTKNNPYIEARKPEIQLLYEELSYLTGSCFKEQLHDVGNWKTRLTEAAQEAEDNVDMFLSSAIIKNDFKDTSPESDGELPLPETFFFTHRFESEVELTYSQIKYPVFFDNILNCSLQNLKDVMDDLKAVREEIMSNKNLVKRDMMMDKKIEATRAACSSGNTRVNLSATEHEELIVGFDDDAELILDRLTRDRKKLDVISIVGIGGLGKTTLATKIFNDSLVGYHFDIRGWITVSQAYSKRDMLLQLLASIGQSVHEAMSEPKLCETLYQSLKCRRYLIVIDDIWSCKAWDDVGLCFPDDNKGSRVVVTTRLTEVALHVSQGGFTHNLGHLNEDRSWELLCRKTLIRLWMAEGFIKEAGQRSLEEEGEYHLMDLIDRNLLIVADKSSDGGIKSCRLHDLLREVCLKKASEENFFQKMSMPMSNSSLSDLTSNMVKQRRRVFTDYNVLYKFRPHGLSTRTRSVLCFHNNHLSEYRTTRWVPSFLLLRVLDLLNIPMFGLGKIKMLLHLRYLAVWLRSYQSSFKLEASESSFSKASLGSLQTLIVKGKFQSFIYSPDYMVNLRHLRCDRIDFSTDFCGHRLFNLQTISQLRLDQRAQYLLESFPYIKKLGCYIASTSSNHGLLNFSSLPHLEALNIEKYIYDVLLTSENPIRFPETLKKLTLKGLCLPLNYMSMIQRLPKLEVLKLLDSSIKGHLWETGDGQFKQLKYLKLEKLNIRVWEASSINFPCLRKLVVRNCENLKEIPLALGNIYTLEHIEIDSSNSRVLESVNRLQEAQREMGNYDIHVSFTRMDPSEVFFEGDPFYD